MPHLNELRTALLGRHAPADQRIVLKSLWPDGDPDTMKAKQFAMHLDEIDVAMYSVSTWPQVQVVIIADF
jgi:hypothetical protein